MFAEIRKLKKQIDEQAKNNDKVSKFNSEFIKLKEENLSLQIKINVA